MDPPSTASRSRAGGQASGSRLPFCPGRRPRKQAGLLFLRFFKPPTHGLPTCSRTTRELTGPRQRHSARAPLIRQLVSAKYHDQNVISESYKHVDGTSFSSPIVASIAAQMIEANPGLKPLEIKAILTRTARRVEELKPEQQGFGVVDPRGRPSRSSSRDGRSAGSSGGAATLRGRRSGS